MLLRFENIHVKLFLDHAVGSSCVAYQLTTTGRFGLGFRRRMTRRCQHVQSSTEKPSPTLLSFSTGDEMKIGK